MLDGLDRIDWARLTHAYGPATDVPDLLRAVAGEDQAARKHALHELWGNIHHQGTVYEASAPAVPFLARLAVSETLPAGDRESLVWLLGAIGGGSSYLEVHAPLLRNGLAPRDRPGLVREREWVEAARQAVARAAPALLVQFPRAGPGMRRALLYLASQVPEAATEAASHIRAFGDETSNEHVRAAARLTLALIDGEELSDERVLAIAGRDPDVVDALREPVHRDVADKARCVAGMLLEDALSADE